MNDHINNQIPRLEVSGTYRDGKRRFDPASKERLVTACLQPGVSVAGLALEHGVNANLLRKWVAARQHGSQTSAVAKRRAPLAFIPVAEAPHLSERGPALQMAATPATGDMAAPPLTTVTMRSRLNASMPNGVTLTLEGGDPQLLSVMIEVLGRYDVPSGC